MRIIKTTVIGVILLPILGIAGFLLYAFLIEPTMWYPEEKKKSIQILQAAKTTSDLTNAVGTWGCYFPLTNNAWIAIRYRDIHGGHVQSSAIALDSGGGWFESKRHFCGILRSWPEKGIRIVEMENDRKLRPGDYEGITTEIDFPGGMFPSNRELLDIADAPNLETARIALQKIGFTPIRPDGSPR